MSVLEIIMAIIAGIAAIVSIVLSLVVIFRYRYWMKK